MLLSSCLQEFQASMDASKRRYNADNNDPGANKSLMAFNIAAMSIFKIQSGNPDGPPTSASQDEYGNLIASLPVDVNNLFTLQSFSERTKTVSYKPPSASFLDDVHILTGIEYIGRRSHDGPLNSTLNYLKVPAFAIYERDLGSGQVYGGIGPYLAYGIGGKSKLTFNGNTTKTKSFDKQTGLKRFDAGINWTIGYRFPNEISIRLGQDIGVVNIGREDAEFKEWNRTTSLNVSYPIEKIKEHISKL